jgi:DNA-binding transcriptional LysR family regulator
VNDVELAARAALDGVGVALVTSIFCEAAVRRGDLRVLFGGVPCWTGVVLAQYLPRPFVPARVRAFVELMRRHLVPLGPLAVADRKRQPRRRRR